MTISFNYTYSFPFRKTVVVILLFPILLTSCSDEGKDVSADAPAQANEKTNDLSEEKNLDTFDNTMASTVVAQVEQNTTSKASSIAPTLVPVLSKEEADALVERMNQDIANAEKGTITFYREDFFSIQGVAGRKSDPHYKKIQETPNFNIVQKEINEDIYPFANMQNGFFTVSSEIPLDYSFVFPLSEHRIYFYSLSICIKGKGIVALSEKNSGLKKEFQVDSQAFETFELQLGDANSFSQSILPMVSLFGDLQIESITIHQTKKYNDRTVCLGTIDSITNVPDIKKANYPDCFYTARFSTKEIIDGEPVPETIQLLIPAFRDNEIDPLSKLMKKGSWKLLVRPFSSAPDKEQEIEQVDELESYEFTPYILVDAIPASIPALHVSGIPILEGKEYLSPYDHPVNPPIPEKYKQESQKTISSELKKIEDIIARADDADVINTLFQEAWDNKQKIHNYEPVSDKSPILWIKEKNSFFALPKKWKFIHPSKISDENLLALIELDRFLKTQGIVFILQIVPNLHDIAALVLNPEFQKYGDQQSAVVAKQLLENGIEAQYISDEIVKHAFDYERLFAYPANFHPESASDIMTTVMAKRLESFSDVLPKQLSPGLFTKVLEDTEKTWPENTKLDIGDHKHGSFVQTPHIYYDGKLLLQTADSNLIVFGNSFVGSPQSKGLGFVSLLASKILYNCSARTMGGVSALTGIPQLFLTDTNTLLNGKKIAVLPISIEFLSGKGYTLTNVRKLDKKFREAGNASLLLSVSPMDYCSSVFPSTISFKYQTLRNYFLSRTGIVALSEDYRKLTIPIPDGLNPKSARISFQPYSLPLYNFTTSITINGSFSHQLVSNYNHPNWEIINYEIPEGTKDITVSLDIANSSKGAIVLIQNVSFYK